MTKPKRPKDPNQLASLIVGIASGNIEEHNPNAGKNPKAIIAGKLGGKIGGKARADKLTPEQRHDIATVAAKARWKKS